MPLKINPDRNLLNTLLLNSVHGKYPRGIDSWVRATEAALRALTNREVSLIASLGLPSWELPAYLAGAFGMKVILVVPGPEMTPGGPQYEMLLEDFNLDREKTRMAFTGAGPEKDLMVRRDRLVFELAEILYPISVRPGGRLAQLLEEYGGGRVQIRDDWQIKWQRGGWHPGYELGARALNPALRQIDSGWLFHWTRSNPGRWADEPPWQFYKALLAEPETYVRHARSTLARIVSHRCLLGSSWNMPGGQAAVSFTALSPAESVGLMRWRRRYTRYSFEPYGLAFRCKSLTKLGAKPVEYYQPGRKPAKRRETLFYQSMGRVGNWKAEKEWRLPGNLNLERIPESDMLIIVPDREEKTELEQQLKVPWQIFNLFEK